MGYFVCMYAHTHGCVDICISCTVHMYICTYICTYICMVVCTTYTYLCMYVHCDFDELASCIAVRDCVGVARGLQTERETVPYNIKLP